MRGTTFVVAMLACAAGQVLGGPIDPLSFTSLGSFDTSGLNTTYTINTSNTPTLTLPNGTTIDGVVYTYTPGVNLAVFDFSSINMAPGTTITATGALPLVLLSQSNAIIDGTIFANGADSPTGGPSAGGPGGGSGSSAAAGPGAGGNSFEGSGGGGFGGNGAPGGIYTPFYGTMMLPPAVTGPAPGGQSYGNLSASLQGGSASSGGSPYSLGGGSGGGGALEIGATAELYLGGIIQANGGSASGLINGGGSGGGIFLHGNAVVVGSDTLIQANGGNGGYGLTNPGPDGGSGGGGGGGGGGQVLIDFGPGGLTGLGTGSIDVAGGSGVSGQASAGQIAFGQIAAPEPSSVVMMTLGLAAVAAQAWRRRLAA